MSASSTGTSSVVLIVDDNRDAVHLLSRVVRRWGYEVHTAHRGDEAVELVERHRPDVVLLDIGLPDMDGYEVAGRLRELEPPFEGALVALTGYARDEDRSRAESAGFNRHVLKPVEVEDLGRLLRELE